MGGNFPLIRHNDFQNWVPETDIDGVDAPRNIVSSIKNFDYRHGYIETAGSLESVALPTNVQTQITAGYSLLSHIYFTHSTQGLTSFSVLWKASASATTKLLFYVNNTAIHPDEQNSNINYSTTPSNINYNLVNDQLKINLNAANTYNSLSTSVILNLTLVYLSFISYAFGLAPSYSRRNAGWYLFPRWLGWSHSIAEENILDVPLTANTLLTNESASLITGLASEVFSSNSVTASNAQKYAGSYSALITDDGTNPGNILISNINYASKITFWARLKGTYQLGTGTPLAGDDVSHLGIEVRDADGNIVVKEYFIDLPYSAPASTGGFTQFTVNLPQFIDGLTFNLRTTLYTTGVGTTGCTHVYIDNLQIYYEWENAYALVAKHFDGQRGLIFYSDGTGVDSNKKITYDTEIKLSKDAIDWRIETFELYMQLEPNGLFYKVGLANVGGYPGWDVVGTLGYFTRTFEFDFDCVETINFNYNLSADIRVDNQRNIYSEISHKNRIYFVNGDYKVYQGHISANLGIQADSFPYDEEVGFGYFEISHQRINKAVAVSPTNDLAIFTDAGIYVYFIEASSAGAFKQLKMLTGSVGLISVNSLVKSNSGDPKTDGLFWCDENGIYYYGGGINPPVNLLVGSHEKYWRDSISLSDKQNSVGTYYPKLNEFWLVVGNIIFTFELPYKAFKTYVLSGNINEFSLVSNTVLYGRIGNALYSYTFTTRSAAEIISHYNAGHNPEIGSNSEVAEIEDKILQEVYMVFGDSDTTTVTMYVYVDDILLGSRIFTTSNNTEKWLMDCGIRFNRIKLKVVTTSGLIRIKEFGCSFVPDFKEQLGR